MKRQARHNANGSWHPEQPFPPPHAAPAALVALFVAGTSGCSSSAETAGYVKTVEFGKTNGNVKLIGYDAARRGQLIRMDDGGNLLDSCSEPPPDAIAALATKLAVETSGTGKGAQVEVSGTSKISRETSQTVLALATKTSETLFLREILFRRCEARMNARRALQSTGNASGPTASDSTGLRQELLKDLKSAENPEKRNLIVGALQRIDADDTFFASVMETYAGLVRAGLDANRVQLLREVLASVPKEDLQDAALLEALKEATASGNIVKVLERAAQLARARAERKAEDAWRKELAQCNADCVDKPKCAERCGSDADCKGRCGSQPKCQAYCEGQHPKPK